MEYNPEEKEIKINKELNNLDKFVLNFVELLDKYVIVSGYVSILFGRSRATEDVDLLIPRMNFKEFEDLWEKIHKNGFECLNTSLMEEAFNMLKNHAIRFSKRGKPLPNIEFKTIKDKIHQYSLDNRIKVIMKENTLFVSPLEMQIAYKLDLGSSKDLEDAGHLYFVFLEKLNKDRLLELIEDFGVENKFEIMKKDYGTKFERIA